MSHVEINLEIPYTASPSLTRSRVRIINTQHGDIVILNRTNAILSSADLSLPSPLTHAYAFSSSNGASYLEIIPIKYALHGPQSSNALTLYSNSLSKANSDFAATLSRSTDGGYYAVEYQVANTLDTVSHAPVLIDMAIDIGEGVGSLEQGFLREPGVLLLLCHIRHSFYTSRSE